MQQRRTSDRRTGLNRRREDASPYTGPERRQLKHRRIGLDRRGLLANNCIYCGSSCGQGDLSASSSTTEANVESRDGICTDCSSKKYPQYYIDS